ncbi:Transposable element Tc1 transposase [Anthophora retusa]
MSGKKELSIETRALIVSHHSIGKSNREIAKLLKLNRRTVDYNVKKYEDTGSLSNKKRSGRPKITTPAEDRAITIISKRNRRKTAPEITAEINASRPEPVSLTTVKRRLRKAGLHGRIAMRKPLLRKQNKAKRLAWARSHKDWVLEDWKKVLWTDESKFEVFGSKRRKFVRRSAGERAIESCISPTVKHGGGSVMVWGCFGSTSVGDLVKIDGILNKERYKGILETNALPSGTRLIGENFVFQQDNDPKHTSKLCRGYLEQLEREEKIVIMTWPPQSPDLNPIELLWEELDRQVRKAAPTSTQTLWQQLQDAWSRIEPLTLTKLLNRMPKLCKAVIKAHGGNIDETKI